jgi:maltokinase
VTATKTEQMKAFVETARWFGGKGRSFEITDVRRLVVPGTSDAETTAPLGLVTIELLTLTYDNPSTGSGQAATEVYQVPVSYYLGPRKPLQHALIGEWEDDELGTLWAYDAMHDHAATSLWLKGFADGVSTDELTFHRVAEAEFDTAERSTILTGEQSNSSVMFGEGSLMKLFRRVTAGENPEIEIVRALTEAGNPHVPALYGWVEARLDGGEPLELGILQQFLRTASDGWELALVSLRNLFAEASVHAREAGGDFASEAERLGFAVAEMHAGLAEVFPTETWRPTELARLADDMSGRLEDALETVPEIAPEAPGLHALFDAVRHLDHEVTAQRVHGDLHLGQTLRTVKNWKIIDFEGEPAKPLEQRRRPDSRWRDVAGMLRSFDYAAELSRMDHQESTGDADANDEALAREWTDRNLTAFISGYREGSGAETDEVLLTAYAADKAVYEAVYEARNRPAWLPIPLGALSRLAAHA